MYLFFDTETTGVPADYKAPLTNYYNWPRLVQLGLLLTDDKFEVINQAQYIVKPDGYVIPKAVQAIHGISQQFAESNGISIHEVLSDFITFCKRAHTFVCHNTNFDRKIIGSELLRNNYEDILHGMSRHCTMLSSVSYCNLPGRYGAKWPKLSELHYSLFKEHFEGAHDALSDVITTHKCFVELVKLGVISLQCQKAE